ncbi:hypothetical protein [Guptibacillus hwajinpoensis]|uniref:hypothetical protein n=1 Tax=Guptibacillus hwajinpoensis TaxID=208199 RepID=UPI0035194B71
MRLKHLTELRNWDLQETADHPGIANYAGYESAYRTPSLLSLAQIADLFENTVDFMIGRGITKSEKIKITGDTDQSTFHLTLPPFSGTQ